MSDVELLIPNVPAEKIVKIRIKDTGCDWLDGQVYEAKKHTGIVKGLEDFGEVTSYVLTDGSGFFFEDDCEEL